MQLLKNTGGVLLGALFTTLATTVVVPIGSFIFMMLFHLALWEWPWWDVISEAVLFTVRVMVAIMWFLYMIVVGVVAINHEMHSFGELWDSTWRWLNKW